ncbi:hypothetical protein [Candidatus Nitrosotenuis uzonensis]|uniref:Uncharacterized protein n=1 Tax=Candidatus Nitrosotenuis uzonensis TaxID=1407055 RepID=A0A812EVK4_9ARCH|nr:hypothetical protein [Candidatus Nitrosotenuis uzonensis]CAE6493579.1 hypothetical protein NUZ5A_50180 [Candidatus Nitrosotenuis uzonensis]
MLAFELYQKNKDSTTGDVKSLKPIKKIIYNKGTWNIDVKTIEEYGSDISSKFSAIQNWLSMPLSTTDPDELNLPDHRTSPAQPSPYILIYGALKTNKSKKSLLTLSIGKKPHTIEHVIDISTKQITEKQSKQVSLKLEKNNYKIDGKAIFDLYVESGIINKKGVLDKSEYQKIISRLTDYITKRNLENAPIGLQGFTIHLLPSADKISFENEER